MIETNSTNSPAPAPQIVQKPDTGRFASQNIRLSAALCSLGYHLRDDAEPVSLTVNVQSQPDLMSTGAAGPLPRVVTFWHNPDPDPAAPIAQVKHPETGKPWVVVAIDVLAWWDYPGRYTIPGFDDALTAMRHVLEAREWLLGLIHGSRRIENSRFNRAAVVTDSLHTASIIKASGFPLLAFERIAERDCRFVFSAAAVGIVEQIERYSSPRRDDGRDRCADWMLSALRFRDLLQRRVRQCLPMIEVRSGDRSMKISAQMPKAMRRDFTRHF